jgi:hypothetical protein
MIKQGRRPNFDEILMVKFLVLQLMYGLSDPEIEQLANDRISFLKFFGFPEKIPDQSTIWYFREFLIKHKKLELVVCTILFWIGISCHNPQLTGKKIGNYPALIIPLTRGMIRLRCASDGHLGSAEDASEGASPPGVMYTFALVMCPGLEPVPFSNGLSRALPSPALKWGHGERDGGFIVPLESS